MDLRIGIVSWNTEKLLARCLSSLPAALGDVRAEVVVVDNASTDGSVAVARACTDVDVTVRVRSSNAGYAIAMNDALSDSAATFLLALNPDTELPAEALARLVAHLRAHPDVGLAVPGLAGSDGRPQRSIYPYPGVGAALEVGFVPPPLRRRMNGPHHDLRRQWAVGAVHCIRAGALGGDAPYTERWFMYGEDIELCWRLGQAGWQLAVLPDVTVVHHANAAGRQRWGEGAALELRSLPSIYSWLWSARSPTAGRATAAVNVLGLSAKEALLRAAFVVRGGMDGGAALGTGDVSGVSRLSRRRADELASLRRYHAAVLRRGPAGVGDVEVDHAPDP